MEFPSVVEWLEPVGASIYGDDYKFVMNVEHAMGYMPESLHTSFLQFAKCLFEKRHDSVYVRQLKDATFRRGGVGFFPRKMKEAGIHQPLIETSMMYVKLMFVNITE